MPSSNFSIEAFVGLSEEDLLTIKLSAITAIKDGAGSVSSISSVNAPGLSVSYFTHWLPTDVLMACNFALKRLEKRVIRRTNAIFL